MRRRSRLTARFVKSESPDLGQKMPFIGLALTKFRDECSLDGLAAGEGQTMKKNHAVYLSALLVLWISLSVFPLLDSLSAAECQLIRIFGERGAAGNQIQIEPIEAAIPRDTCIVWINWVQWSKARIIFREDAKACRSATQSPSGFTEIDAFYTTSFMPRGGTSSLTFVGKGKFRYKVEVPDQSRSSLGLPPGQIVAEGTLVVE
jgi:hypothetical protein